MTDYTVAKGDTYASIAKQLYCDEAAADALARFNNASDPSKAPTEGAGLKAPVRLYGMVGQSTEGDAVVVTLHCYSATAGAGELPAMVLFSPATGKYLVVAPSAESKIDTLNDQAKQSGDLARKLQDAWKSSDPASMLKNVKDIASEIEQFFAGLAQDPEKAIEELVVVKGHDKWADQAKRFFARPSALDQIVSEGVEWKEATDQKLTGALNALKRKSQLAQEVLDQLCQSGSTMPPNWKFAQKAAAGALASAGQRFATDVTARFMRFVSGMGIDQKLDAVEKKLQLNKFGDLTFSLLNGSLSGQWYVPDQTGLNLFELINFAPKSGPAPVCLLRFYAKAEGHVFSKGGLSGALKLPNLDLKALSGKGGGTGALSGAASGGGSLSAQVEWSASSSDTYRDLATLSVSAQGGAALSGKQALDVSFKKGSLRGSFPSKLVKGFDGDGSISFDAPAEEGIALITYLFSAIVKHYFEEVTHHGEGMRELVTSRFEEVADHIKQGADKVVAKATDIARWFSEGEIREGRASASWRLPDEDGFDLVGVLRKAPPLAPLLKPDAQCWVRFNVAMNGYVFGKTSGSGSGGGAAKLAGLAGTAGAAAGVSAGAQAGVSAAAQWRPDTTAEFKSLGDIIGMGKLDVGGLGKLAAAAGMDYKKGNLRCILPVHAMGRIGSGKKGSVILSAHGDEADKLVHHLFASIDLDVLKIPGLDKLVPDVGKVVTDKLGGNPALGKLL